ARHSTLQRDAEVRPGPPRPGPEEQVRQRWQARWFENEFARQLFEAARPHFLRVSAKPFPLLTTGIQDVHLTADVGHPLTATQARRVNAAALFWFAENQQRNESDARAKSSQWWLAKSHPVEKGDRWIFCEPEEQVRTKLNGLLQSAPKAPGYFGVSLDLAG